MDVGLYSLEEEVRKQYAFVTSNFNISFQQPGVNAPRTSGKEAGDEARRRDNGTLNEGSQNRAAADCARKTGKVIIYIIFINARRVSALGLDKHT